MPRPATGPKFRVAADVGGTFTDVVAFDETSGSTRFGKVLTTPSDLVAGILNGVARTDVRLAETGIFLHGTTVAINTILERSGAKTALLTTRGFRDVYEIGRINRPDAYNLFFRKHEPLVPRARRFEIAERMSAAGGVLVPLDEGAVQALAGQLLADEVEAVAILFLHSYANPAHEIRAREILQELCPGMFVTASHEVSQEYREYERTSTVVANAYVGPRVNAYLGAIEARLADASFGGDFFVVQSSGGLYGVGDARRECIRMLESGPAAGVIGAREVCLRLGLDNAIAFDMGGTTAKAGVVVDGAVAMAGSIMIGGYASGLPIQIPLIEIQEVGTGGGSIARVEAGGGLRVGPQSAGADPGPVCYGLGGIQPTVTDANLILGRLAPDRFLGGEMQLDLAAAREALESKVAHPLGIPVVAAADGIIRIAVTTMAHVVTRVTTERGLDAANFAMVAYGGAGPLHATLVARELRIPKVIIPPAPGHFSAYGMLVADLRSDSVRTWFRPLAELRFEELETLFSGMEAENLAAVAGERVEQQRTVSIRAADMRYVGQEHSVTVEFPASAFAARDIAQIKALFDAVHLRRYGFNAPREGAEIVSLLSSVVGFLEKPAAQKLAGAVGSTPGTSPVSQRSVHFGQASGFIEVEVHARSSLVPHQLVAGPALIEEHASTTVLLPGDAMQVGAFGDLIIEVGRGE